MTAFFITLATLVCNVVFYGFVLIGFAFAMVCLWAAINRLPELIGLLFKPRKPSHWT